MYLRKVWTNFDEIFGRVGRDQSTIRLNFGEIRIPGSWMSSGAHKSLKDISSFTCNRDFKHDAAYCDFQLTEMEMSILEPLKLPKWCHTYRIRHAA